VVSARARRTWEVDSATHVEPAISSWKHPTRTAVSLVTVCQMALSKLISAVTRFPASAIVNRTFKVCWLHDDEIDARKAL